MATSKKTASPARADRRSATTAIATGKPLRRSPPASRFQLSAILVLGAECLISHESADDDGDSNACFMAETIM